MCIHGNRVAVAVADAVATAIISIFFRNSPVGRSRVAVWWW